MQWFCVTEAKNLILTTMFEIIKIYTKNAQNFIQSYKEAITVDVWLVFYFDYANSELEKQNRNM